MSEPQGERGRLMGEEMTYNAGYEAGRRAERAAVVKRLRQQAPRSIEVPMGLEHKSYVLGWTAGLAVAVDMLAAAPASPLDDSAGDPD